MRKNIIIGAFALFAFLLLVFTCPNKQDHEEAITYVVSSLISNVQKITSAENLRSRASDEIVPFREFIIKDDTSALL